MKNIIALDIDDCILPSNNNYFGRTEDDLQILEINLKRLRMIIEKYNFEVFITSSWYSILELNDGYLKLKSDRSDYTTLMGFGLIKKYIGKNIIGLSDGCREEDIRGLVKEGNKVVILDDWKLQHLQDEDKTNNTLYIEMIGFIDANVGFMINKFMKENKIIKRRMD